MLQLKIQLVNEINQQPLKKLLFGEININNLVSKKPKVGKILIKADKICILK